MDEKAREERMLKAIGLPDDLVEVALKAEPSPAPNAVARIRRMALERLAGHEAAGGEAPGAPALPGQRRRAGEPESAAVKTRRRRWASGWAVAAAILLAVAGTVVALGPNRVAAGMQRLLAFVPGFGVQEAGEVRLAAPGPVRVERDGRWVEVRGLVAGADGVTLHLVTRGVPVSFERVKLLGPDGAQVDHSSGSIGTAGGGPTEVRTDGWLSFDYAVDPGTRELTVLVQADGEWRLAVPLVPGDRLLPASEFGPVVAVNGYEVAARVQAYPDRTELLLLVQGGEDGVRVSEVGRGGRAALSAPGWRAEAGGHITRSGQDLWQMEAGPLPPDVADVTVRVEQLAVIEPGLARVRVPVRTGELDETVQIGRWPLRLSRTEVREDGSLRVYVDPGPADGPTFLRRFGGLEVGGRPVSWSSRHDEAGEQMVWFELDPPAGARSVLLTLREAETAVRGPWVLAVPVVR